jgi:putative PIN family toxin of toxin-antitoxin system
MIVVLDTNVLVSGILKPHSKAAVVVRLAAEGVIQLAYDVRLVSEYREVLRRPKFGFPVDAVDSLLAEMEEEGLSVTAAPLKFRLPDPYDEPFLEVALAARAAVLITGNKRHFPKKASGGVRILSPAEFLELLKR